MEDGYIKKNIPDGSLRFRVRHHNRNKEKELRNQKIRDLFFLFVLIFSPPFIPYPHLLLTVYSIYKIIVKYRYSYKKILKYSGQQHWIMTMLFLGIYALVIILVNELLFSETVNIEHYISLFNRFAVLLITIIPCCTLYILELVDKKKSIFYFVEEIISVGMLQTCFAFASFASSDIHNFLVNLMYRTTGDSWFENQWLINTRTYGFAGTFVDLFGVGMGLIAGISLLYGFYSKRKYLFYSVLIAIAGALNARTTLVIYVLSLLFVFLNFSIKQKVKILVWLLLVVLAVSILWNPVITFLEETSMATFSWMESGYSALIDLINGGQKNDVFSILFSENFWQMPSGFQLLFGSGHSLYGASGYRHSDVGYINDLWFVGIVGILWMYGSIALILLKWWGKEKNPLMKNVVLYLSVAALVFNVKGALIGYNPGAAVFFSAIFVFGYFARTQTTGE